MASVRQEKGFAGPEQTEFFSVSPRVTKKELEAVLAEPRSRRGPGVRPVVTMTRNRVSMVSVQFLPPNVAKVRLHEAFLDAPPDVLRALRDYLWTRRRASWGPVAAFARGIEDRSAPLGRPAAGPPVQSRVHDLAAIHADVNRRFFQGRVRCRVEWGRRRPRRRRRTGRGRSIRFGAWYPATRTVRVHPLLDDERVPRFFVEYIVFHELLHAVVPAEKSGGRRYDHSATYRRLERSFPHYDEARSLVPTLLAMLT